MKITKEEQAVLDAFQQGAGVGYVAGMRAEREACLAILNRWYEGMSSEPEMLEIYNEIRARG